MVTETMIEEAVHIFKFLFYLYIFKRFYLFTDRGREGEREHKQREQ